MNFERRIRELFAAHGFAALTVEEVVARLPEDLLEESDRHCETLEDIVHFVDRRAPYHHLFNGLYFDLELEITTYLAEQIAARRPAVVLCAGCGTAFQLSIIAELFPDILFFGNDLSPVSIKLAKERIAKRALNNLTVVVCAHEQLDDALPEVQANLTFTHSSLDCGTVQIPDFSQSCMAQDVLLDFIQTDPVIQRWARSIRAIHDRTAPGGAFIEIGMMRGMMRDVTGEIITERFTEDGDEHVFQHFFDEEYGNHPYYANRVLAIPFRRN